MDQAQWRLEQERLKEVYNKICAQLKLRRNEVENYRKNVTRTGRKMWEEADHTWERGDIDAAVEIKQYMDVLEAGKPGP